MVSTDARRVWVVIAWSFAIAATTLNGLVVGYGSVWLQFFGESADAEDYRVSAGGYGAAAAVLALAVVAILTHRGPRWLAWVAALSSIVLGALAVSSAQASTRAEQDSSPMNTAWDGIGGVLWAPWTWALVALAVHGIYRLARGDSSRGDAAPIARVGLPAHPSGLGQGGHADDETPPAG